VNFEQGISLFGALSSIVVIYYIMRQKEIRPLIRSVSVLFSFFGFTLILASNALVYDANESINLMGNTIRGIGFFFGVLLLVLFSLLMTDYTHINHHKSFLKEFRKNPSHIFLIYLIVYVCGFAVLIYTNPELYPIESRTDTMLAVFITANFFLISISFLLISHKIAVYMYKKYLPPTIRFRMNMLLGGAILYGIGTLAAFTAHNLGTVNTALAETTIGLVSMVMIVYSLREPGFMQDFIDAKTEDSISEERKYWLEAGNTYLVDGKKKAYDIFIDGVRHNTQGLIISRENPEIIKKRYGLEKTNVVWMSDVAEEVNSNIKPQPRYISWTLQSFIERSDDSIVLLEGIEYLIHELGFDTTLLMIANIRDLVSIAKSRLVIAANFKSLDEKQIEQLKNECILV
jgi:hypothetical protein